MNKLKKRYRNIGLIIILTLLSSIFLYSPITHSPGLIQSYGQYIGDSTVPSAQLSELQNQETIEIEKEELSEWLIKWNGETDQQIYDDVDVLEYLEDQKLMKVRLKSNVLKGEWLEKWSKHPAIEYISPNVKVTISEDPNDTHIENQQYLKQIHAQNGWDIVTNTEFTIAILDTGVDLFHPDLKDNLVEGYNLLNKSMPPQDDNGHGTNVAGIVAAVGNNNLGITGVSWKAKIMPLKVLDRNGEGESFIVGQGIRYAVDKGAKIILLSLGEPIYTPFMKEAVDYAEENGVLVVAASGNEGNRLNYPAALPNVLSVGAVDIEDRYVTYSNYGQQIDVVAPGEGIYTTKQGGGYTSNTGTSMAAPQVAGLAALLMQVHTTITPREIRDIIKFTADDVHELGWDNKTGYGRINVTRALEASLSILKDGHEPNNSMQTAAVFPLYDMIYGQISYTDTDWFKLNLPYDGNVQLNLQMEQEVPYPLNIQVISLDGEEQDAINYSVKQQQKIDLNLAQGEIWIKIYFPEVTAEQEAQFNHEIDPNLNISYTLKNNFTVYKDQYESNDYSWDAFPIENLSKKVIGTFHKEKDIDWYKIQFDQPGKLMIRTAVDTLRMDPMITIQFADRRRIEIDEQGWGKTEFTTLDIEPGVYYIQISDYNGYTSIEGEYTLEFLFYNETEDRYEPNDISSLANEIHFNESVNSKIEGPNDIDWFKIRLNDPLYLSFSFKADLPVEANFYDQNLHKMWEYRLGEWSGQQVLEPGIYYLRLRGDHDLVSYQLTINSRELDGAFTDIADHWAKDTIVNLYDEGIISGFEDHTFRPDLMITRAEVAEIINKTLLLSDVEESFIVPFTDIAKGKWYYSAIAKSYQAGIITGYTDGTFKPNSAINRDELIVILSRAFEIPIQNTTTTEFMDLIPGQFAYNEINTFKQLDLISGYQDQTYRPKKVATRGEFVTLLSKVRAIDVEN